ncbi:PRC-barrel domain containing protein [Kitasatospora sp. NPDC090308]|uniref:PRC-barrel domain containing protein n=1 Tax=Kitasatospora sp. NPDC090308 TaxID=3364082 RepID=UPI00382C24CC
MAEGIWDWENAEGYATGVDLTDYRVEAADGRIGKVDKHSEDVGDAYLLVDTGPWIFGRVVLVPAGTVTRIDHDDRSVWLSRMTDEIKNSPDFAPGAPADDHDHRRSVGAYYLGTA